MAICKAAHTSAAGIGEAMAQPTILRECKSCTAAGILRAQKPNSLFAHPDGSLRQRQQDLDHEQFQLWEVTMKI